MKTIFKILICVALVLFVVGAIKNYSNSKQTAKIVARDVVDNVTTGAKVSLEKGKKIKNVIIE